MKTNNIKKITITIMVLQVILILFSILVLIAGDIFFGLFGIIVNGIFIMVGFDNLRIIKNLK